MTVDMEQAPDGWTRSKSGLVMPPPVPTRSPWCRWAREERGADAEGWHAMCHRQTEGRLCTCACHGESPRARARRGGEP